MRNSFTLRLLIVVTILTLVLFGMIARKQWTLTTGTPVLLETQPVDPRSLFRGDYVRLNYSISTLETDAYPALKSVKRGDVVFVSIAPGKPYWQAVAVSDSYPESGLAIKAYVERVQLTRWNGETQKWDDVPQVVLKYGIENYFVPEGKGRAIERPADGARVSIEVAVDHFGNAGIRAVLVDDKPRYVETLF